jgi:hypothetical protein
MGERKKNTVFIKSQKGLVTFASQFRPPRLVITKSNQEFYID